MTLLRRYKRPLQWFVALVALVFLVRILVDSWSELQRYPFTVQPIILAVSLVALILTLLFDVVSWLWSVRWLGASLAFVPAARIWFLSNVVRYIPGSVWQPLTLIVLSKERGVGEVHTATSLALNWILSNLSGLLVALIYWIANPASPSLERLWLLPIVVLAAFMALHPALLDRVLRLLSKAARQTNVPVMLSFNRLLFLLLVHCLSWLCYGLSFAIFWNALYPLDWRELPRLIGAFAGAYVIGFVSVLTPSGLGVREGALVFFLSGAFPVAVVTVIALLSRVWLIVGELMCTGLVLFVVSDTHA